MKTLLETASRGSEFRNARVLFEATSPLRAAPCCMTPSVITTASTATTMVFNAVASTNTQGLSEADLAAGAPAAAYCSSGHPWRR